MVYTITRKFEFDAGHRVYQHESKCAHVHGHRYVVELECEGKLDGLGRVIDFSVLKSICGKWVDDNLDHGMILFIEDPLTSYWSVGFADNKKRLVDHHKYYVMDKNPTAENIAQHLFYKFTELISHLGINVVSVVVQETPNCRAEFRL